MDWAGRRHALCVLDADGAILVDDFYPHAEKGLQKMTATMLGLGVRRVAIERPDGLLVDRLVEADLTVMPVNAGTLVAVRPRYRAGGGKSDSIDAYCLAELARTDSRHFHLLAPDSDETKALRQLTRAREQLVGVKVHLGNQLRAQLEDFWPGAARIFAHIDSQISLTFLRRYPSPAEARELDEALLTEFLHAHRYGGFGRRSPADLLERLRTAPQGTAGDAETAVRRAAVLGSVGILEKITAEIADLDGRISEAIRAHPDGKIFLPLFRTPTSIHTAAALVAEIGDDRGRYRDSEALAAKAGVVPVVRASGTRSAVLFRRARNIRLQGAVCQLAEATRRHDPWARAIYERARARGHRHPHALRILGRAWLRVLWRCWMDRVPYDPGQHGARQALKAEEAE